MNAMPDNPLRILIVEDEPGDRGLIHIHLHRAGYGLEGGQDTLLLAGSLAQAKELLGSNSADLVLLDLSLPDSHGLDTVTAMHQLLPGVPIIVMSGNTDLNTAISALQQGAQDYLVKGQYNHELLGKVMRQALERARLENRLRLLEAALKATSNAVLITDAESRIEWSNPAFTRLTGYTPDEVQGKLANNLCQMAQEQGTQPWHDLLTGEPLNREGACRRKDGGLYHEELSISPVRDASGKVTHFIAVKHDITKRKQAEEKLQAAHQLLNNLVENLPDMVFMKDARDLRFQLFNRAGEELVGHKREDLIGRNDYDFFPMEQADFFIAKDREVLAQDSVVDIPEEPINTPHGTRTLHTKKISIRDAMGQPQFLLGISEDITERKLAEEALRKSELRLQSVLAASPIITYALDSSLTLTFVSGNIKAVTGFEPDEALNSSWWPQHLHPEDRGTAIRISLSALEAGKVNQEYRLRFKDGSYHWIHDSMNLVRDDAGQVQEIVGTWSDITARKHAEEALRIAAITFESQNGTIVTDMFGHIIQVNKAFTRITGYEAEEAIGRTPAMLQSGKHDRRFYVQLWDRLKNNGYWEGEIWNRRKNGEIYAEWLTVTAVLAPDGRIEHYVGTFHDITEQKRAQSLVQHMAHHDALTGLPNRALFTDRLQQALAIARREQSLLALMFIDLDKFKPINDELGHEVGDHLLKEVAWRMQHCVRESDTVARIGGDEFVVLLPVIEEAQDALHVAEKIRHALNQSFEISGRSLNISSSTGVAVYPQHGSLETELMKHADVAMYQAKQGGRNSVVLYHEGMQGA